MATKGLTYNPDTGSYNTAFWTPDQWKRFGAAGGTIDGDKLMLNGTAVNTPEVTSIFGTDGFGLNTGTMKGLGSIGDMASGLGSLYLGSKQLGLAEDTAAFNKDMLTKQYNMAKDAYDKQTARASSIGSQMQAGKVG